MCLEKTEDRSKGPMKGSRKVRTLLYVGCGLIYKKNIGVAQ